VSYATESTGPISDRSGVTDSVRVQILATEHWSLLATRGLGWNEVYSRAGMFLNVLSAAVVALALVAQATDFGQGFRTFGYLVLPVVLFVGWTTYIRLTDASYVDLWMVVGMNRLRHAYLELAPELAPFFITAHTDDIDGVMQTLGFGRGGTVSGIASSTPLLVGTITSVVAGCLAGLVVEDLGGSPALYIAAGTAGGLICLAAMFAHHMLAIRAIMGAYRPRFPGSNG
jgi:hypothetical protein